MKTTAPLTKTQMGLYVECDSHKGEAIYNIPYIYELDGSLDGERLCRAIEAAVAVHPALFTRFEINDEGEPRQTVDDTETFAVSVEEIQDIEAEKTSFIQPFDLLKDRLFRIRLLKDKEHFYILQDTHHIISDGSSRKILLSDIETAYNGGILETEPLTQSDVALAEEELRKTPAFETSKQWYAQNFDCSDCYSPLLPDLEETEPKEGRITRALAVNMDKVESWCKEKGIFKSTFFTAAYACLLARFNNESEVLFDTVYNGRADKKLSHTMAMLVRTFPVYAKYTDDTTVLDFLKSLQEQMTGCRQHEAYAYSDMVTDLGVQAATLFAWHGTLFDSKTFCGKPMNSTRLNNNTREVPIYLKAYIKDGHACIEAEYDASLYS